MTDKGMNYNASSPDELALLNFARFIGYEYQGMDENNEITISVMKSIRKFKLLHILEFDSTRYIHIHLSKQEEEFSDSKRSLDLEVQDTD